ncbi:MAG: hypothetical protein JXD19_12020 [Deltaproteobacteria bacterium]|nr:hypothetical protein [Deltaproteobacteria bacterium]
MNQRPRKRYSTGAKLLWWLSAQAVRGFIFLIGICPACLFPPLGTVLGLCGFYLLVGRQRIGVDNVRTAFGETMSRKEARALVKKNFQNTARDFIEMVACCDTDHQVALANSILVHGKEHLDKALAKGKGVILVSAHLGNFPIIGVKLASLGYSPRLIYKEPKNIYLVGRAKQWMDQVGIGVIPYKPRRRCALEIIKELKNNGIIILLIDQNPRKKDGVYVEFFGQAVPTYRGPVVMAVRAGAAIVPLFIHRNRDNREVITILPELALKRSPDLDRDIIDNLRVINALYEKWIVQHPDQWWWVHRRFRRARTLNADDG